MDTESHPHSNCKYQHQARWLNLSTEKNILQSFTACLCLSVTDVIAAVLTSFRWSTSEGEWSEHHRESLLWGHSPDPRKVGWIYISIWITLASWCILPTVILFSFPNSGEFLELCVMPKDEDILQLVSFSLPPFLKEKKLSLKCVFKTAPFAPVPQWAPLNLISQSCSSLRCSCWDSSHEMQAARPAIPSELSM